MMRPSYIPVVKLDVLFQVADSFGAADPFSQPQVSVPSLEQDKVMPLQKPPKWLRKPVGASFAVS